MLKLTTSRRIDLVRLFSTHVKVAVVGGGTAGMAASAQITNSPNFKAEDVFVFEPRDEHHYQPSYTMIGGGVISTNPAKVKSQEHKFLKRPMDSMFKTGVTLKKEEVLTFDPANNKFDTNKGTYTYDYLVVAPGLRLRYDLITGAQEALDDPDHPVVSIYREDYAYKTLRFRERMHEGNAIFYQPPMPVKCGGAPQKILYLSDSRWKEQGRINKINVKYYTALPIMFPPCEKYSIALNKVREEKNIPVFYKHNLKAVDKDNKIAKFHRADTDETVEVPYDFLHICPPQSSHKFVADSPLADATGFCAVDKATLQHPKYSNVFSCGDAGGTPTSKTAASAFSQVPVLVHNMNDHFEGKELKAKYDGYSS